MNNFQEILKKLNINPNVYLSICREISESKGYNAYQLHFSDKKNKKLMYIHNGNKIHFGDSRYNDFIIYNFMFEQNLITEEYADKRREIYLARARKIFGIWRNNNLSPNNLAIKILWAG